MYRVDFSDKVIASIDTYSLRYREYFRNLYQDSGVWNEEKIIESYINESIFRVEEIYKLLNSVFSQETILGRKLGNMIQLPWRSKILLVTWKEENMIRSIETLEII